MDYVNLGRTGLKVSRLCFGCMTYGLKSWRPWVLTEEEGRPFLDAALDAGINFFDTADQYSLGENEAILGRFLYDRKARNRVVVATKLYNPMSDDPNDRGLSRRHVFQAVDASLKRLGTDWIDLYQLHRWDYHTPIEETIDALNDVVRAGKVRYLGGSSMFAWQFMKAIGLQRANGYAQFVSMQPQLNLLYREEEREMLPLCRSEGIGVIPWSPIARGRLAGATTTSRAATDDIAKRYYPGDAQEVAIVDAVRAVAERRGVNPATLALAWVLSRPGITAPIIGASKPGHFTDAIAALSLQLDDEEKSLLEAPYRPRPVAGPL
ncbi:aldo/keto reductase [Roseiterribacter gracilis]|uniref:Aldo/keto reductase n=1 Tax=Roseiterribacter gracilis TaxID=2812848 RepID=A0A8S8X784_9PROT|nr:aldo/keto reductase [Rhodospirillales bacterium TMPK1]